MPVLGYLKESTCCSLDVSAAQIFRELGFQQGWTCLVSFKASFCPGTLPGGLALVMRCRPLICKWHVLVLLSCMHPWRKTEGQN